MFVKGSTVFADISKFVEICGLQLPGTVHAVWNDGEPAVTPPGMNSIGAGDTTGARNLRDLELKLKDLNDAIEAVRKLGGEAEAKGFEEQVGILIEQLGDRFDGIKGAAGDTSRKMQEDASAPLVEGTQQGQGQDQMGMDMGGLDMGGGAPMDLSGAGNENGGDFGDFAALSSAQEEGNTSPSGTTAPNPNEQQQNR